MAGTATPTLSVRLTRNAAAAGKYELAQNVL